VVTVISMLAGLAIAVLWHEAAHALFALATSRGCVVLQVGVGPSRGFRVGRLELRVAPVPLGGFCSHDGGERPGDRALIAAAGPVSSALLAALAYSLRDDLWQVSHALVNISDQVVISSAFAAVLTAVPIAYPGGSDSDGLAVLRALWPASWLVIKAPRGESRAERPLRAPFAILLALAAVGAFMASFWLGAFLVGMFGLLYLSERHSDA
jgi:hypothetical protein